MSLNNFKIEQLIYLELPKALWLEVGSHSTSFNQSECTFPREDYDTVKFIFDTGSWLIGKFKIVTVYLDSFGFWT